jgi:gliding motility-associated protein GldM
MSIPKDNRQQMINLMYLVLTALLALNVSSEILNAFRTITQSLTSSNKLLDVNTQTAYNGFASKKAKEPANAEIDLFKAKADKVMTMSKDLQTYIASLQSDLIKEAGGPGEDGATMKRQDDLDASTRYFIEDNKKGYELKKKIDEFKSSAMGLVDPTELEIVEGRIPLNTTPQKANGDWARDNFYQMPPVASNTMLTKMLSDIKATEGQLVSYFYSKIGDMKALDPTQIVFDKFSAQITAPTAYILQGETFEANVSLAATSSKSSGTVTVNVNGTNVPVDQATGVAKYKASPGVGEYPIRGSVSVKNDRTGQVTSYPLPEFKYTVAAPFASVSPTKMNVFYIGVDNPIQVSAAGVANSKLSVSLDAGTATGNAGVYQVRVSTPGTTNVNVSANGKSYGKFPFRVKTIPDPAPKVGGRKSGPFPLGEWRAQIGPYAELENFEFDAKFAITSFNMFYQPKVGGDPQQLSTQGTKFSAAMQSVMAKAKPGDIFYIEEIKAVGPDGKSRSLPAVAFKMK